MAIVVDKEWPVAGVEASQNGFQLVRGIAHFSTTDLTGTIPCFFKFVQDVQITPLGGGATVATALSHNSAQLGSVSATASFNVVANKAGTISAVLLVTATAVATSDTNYWSFGLVNKTQTLTPVDGTAAGNTTKATGGTAMTGYAVRALTLGVAGQLAVASQDVLEFTATKTSAATTMAESTLVVVISSTVANAETITVDNLSDLGDGIVTPTGGNLTFTRQAVNPTSGLAFFYQYVGYTG